MAPGLQAATKVKPEAVAGDGDGDGDGSGCRQ